ncbi:hypothetical protein BDK51DRAFT_51995 [Blyttiomyces helicus]|uniref:F-box domain-containing protein n=1 Tax=Blyttiomyces helicus TaxID=388810 RepID=A0A4P9W8X2_9FUNG|nr:hypothetical protein BDK51DRAFT_51995 [Blyttiomyces helicus]|eukprot:RKO88824.1 hypothetical protein BDK51DRAFT_51995 [Blyttiomyces helicus]
MTFLTFAHLKESSNLTSAALQRLVRARGANLKYLDLSKIKDVDSDLLTCIAESTPRLEVLGIVECWEIAYQGPLGNRPWDLLDDDFEWYITHQHISVLADLKKGCPKLRYLKLFESDGWPMPEMDPELFEEDPRLLQADLAVEVWLKKYIQIRQTPIDRFF